MPPYHPSPVARRRNLHSVTLGFLPGSCRVCLGVALLALSFGCAASAHVLGIGKKEAGLGRWASEVGRWAEISI
jgi:hypothetical protein